MTVRRIGIPTYIPSEHNLDLTHEDAVQAQKYVLEINNRNERVTKSELIHKPWLLARRVGQVARLSPSTIQRIRKAQGM